MSRMVVVPCPVEIEQTASSFHAYAIPEGVELRPGDVVLVHDAPTTVAFGSVVRRDCSASVRRAGPLRRFWTRATSIFLLTSLYEVGFEPKPAGSAHG